MADVGGMTDAELFAVVVEEARRKGVVVADPTPPASRTCVVNGLRLHLLDWQGEGRPPMLLLHGALLNAHVWDDFSLDMRQHFHIHSVDLPGHGDSEWVPDGDYRRARLAAEITGLIEQLDLTSVVLIGHSLGGSLAALVAARLTTRVAALVMVDSTLLPTGRPSVRSRAASGPTSFASFKELVQHAAGLGRRRDPAQLMVRLRWNARHMTNGRWTWKYDPALLQPTGHGSADWDDVWAALHACPCPVLFVRAGGRSHLSDEAAKRLQALPSVRLVVVPEAGHNVMSDDPLAFRRAVGDFLSSSLTPIR